MRHKQINTKSQSISQMRVVLYMYIYIYICTYIIGAGVTLKGGYRERMEWVFENDMNFLACVWRQEKSAYYAITVDFWFFFLCFRAPFAGVSVLFCSFSFCTPGGIPLVHRPLPLPHCVHGSKRAKRAKWPCCHHSTALFRPNFPL